MEFGDSLLSESGVNHMLTARLYYNSDPIEKVLYVAHKCFMSELRNMDVEELPLRSSNYSTITFLVLIVLVST